MKKTELLNQISGIAIDAGMAILGIYEKEDHGVTNKEDKSPLTAADTASHIIIVEALEKLDISKKENIPILSEESEALDYDVRAKWSKYWLVDPLDGTKEFINRNREFTVNIALIENGCPVMGVVYVPVLDILYQGDVIKKVAGKIEQASKSHSSLFVDITNPESNPDVLKIVASKSHLNKDTEEIINNVLKEFKDSSFLSAGSSLKFCLVAEGKADFYPRYAPTMEWDTGAADAVCRAAGCVVKQAGNHQPLEYNKENLLNPYFYVSSNKKVSDILESM